VECSFEFLALGPLFPEQQTTEHHRSFRDRTGALEALLANKLRAREDVGNCNVLGVRVGPILHH
jgi:hypothetical protein